MKKILVVIIIFTLVLLSQSKSYASVHCEAQYGGGQNCVKTGEILIDKKVWNPDNNSFVDNLFLSDHVFHQGNLVTFQISVKNTGDARFDRITVTDSLPGELSLSSGSLNYDIFNLDPGQTDTRQFSAKVVSDAVQTCPTNTATAKDANSDESDTDSSKFCLENKVLGVTSLPPTGPSNWQVLLIFGLTIGGIGLYLTKRKTNFWEGVKE